MSYLGKKPADQVTSGQQLADKTVSPAKMSLGGPSWDASGNQTFSGGATFGGLLNTGATGQIKFPATQNPSSDANTLDDYEEGAWTPTLGGTATYNARAGRYTKIGNKVFLEGYIDVAVIGTGSTGDIYGMPFTANATLPLGTMSAGYYASSASAITFLTATIGNGSTGLNLRVAANAATGMNSVNFFQNSTGIYFTANYTV